MGSMYGFIMTVFMLLLIVSSLFFVIRWLYREISVVGVTLNILIYIIIFLSIVQTCLSGLGIMDFFRNISRIMFCCRLFLFHSKYKTHLILEGISLLYFPIKWFITGIGFNWRHYLISIPLSVIACLIIFYDDTQFIYDTVEIEKSFDTPKKKKKKKKPNIKRR